MLLQGNNASSRHQRLTYIQPSVRNGLFFWRCWPVNSPTPSNLIQHYSTGNPPIEKDNIAEDTINLVIKPVEISLLLIWKPRP